MDPITTEVIGNAFQSVAEEMGIALVRSAYSTNIKECRDCSCAVFSSVDFANGPVRQSSD
jgi:N-methylhydantoinase B